MFSVKVVVMFDSERVDTSILDPWALRLSVNVVAMLLRERVLMLILSASDVIATVLTEDRLLRLLVLTLMLRPCAEMFSVKVVVILESVRVETLIVGVSDVSLAMLAVVMLLRLFALTLMLRP